MVGMGEAEDSNITEITEVIQRFNGFLVASLLTVVHRSASLRRGDFKSLRNTSA